MESSQRRLAERLRAGIFSVGTLMLIAIDICSMAQSVESRVLIDEIRVNPETSGVYYYRPESIRDMLSIAMLKNSSLKIESNVPDNRSSSKKKNYDFVIQGDFSFYKDSFFMYLKLKSETATSINLYIPPQVGSYADFYRQLSALTDELTRKITEVTAQKRKIVAVSILNTSSMPGKSTDAEVVSYVLNSMASNVSNTSRVTARILSEREARNMDSLLGNSVVNAVILTTFFRDQNKNLVIHPMLTLERAQGRFSLTPIVISTETDYNDLEKTVLTDFEGLFNYLMTPTGEWKRSAIDTLKMAENATDSVLLLRAQEFLNNGKYFPAVYFANRYTQKVKNDYAGHLVLAQVRVQQNLSASAIAELDEVLKFESGISSVHCAKGLILSGQGYHEQALSAFLQSYELEPDLDLAEEGNLAYYLGYTYLELDSISKAIPFLEYSVRQYSNYVEGWYTLGTTYYQASRYAEALQVFQQYETRGGDPERAKLAISNCYYQIGYVEYYRGNFRQAYKNFVEAKSYYQDEATYLSMIYASNRTGSLVRSDSILRAGLLARQLNTGVYWEQASDLRNIYDTLTNNVLKDAYLLSAINYLHQHIDLNSTDTSALWLLGNSYLYKLDYRKSARYLQEAVTYATDKLAYQLDLGEVYLMMAEPSKARQLFTMANVDVAVLPPSRASYVTLAAYLRVVAAYLLKDLGKIDEQVCRQEEAQLMAILESGVKVVNWSYAFFETWLAQYQGKSRDKIQALTDAMKRRTEYRAQ
jgi:tetratricopeptide (TPR) repeat protein